MKWIGWAALTAGAVWAQHAHHAPKSEKPVVLHKGLGTYSRVIVTNNPETQKFFDQGLKLLYGFNRYEALRSFRRAAELDPQAAMPYWGIGMATAPHINMEFEGDVDMKKSCEALERAQGLAKSALEQAWVKAAQGRCPQDDPERYIAAARALSEAYPDDLDAATFYAESIMIPVRWQWFQRDGSPSGQMAEAIRVLEQVMRRHQEHPGANHLYIHAVEMSPSPERAIASAQRLMGTVPASGHLVHMPGHIWLQLGEWELAANVNERASQLDREYFAATGVESAYVGYYLHNMHFIAYARSMQGRGAEAIAAADRIAADAAPLLAAMPENVEPFAAYPWLMRVRFGQWDELLKMPEPAEKLLVGRALRHWARCLAFAAKGQREAALREQTAFAAAKAALPAERPWSSSKAADVLTLAEALLAGRLADPAAAVEHFHRAVSVQDGLNYDEPPPWYQPLREAWGGALLRNGQAAEAETVFREGLRRTPHNGRMLFGLWKSLEAQGKADAAAMVRREFERDWAKAEVKLRVEDL